MPRMRTAAKVHEIIVAQDPDTEITLHYIKHLIATDAVPVTHVGRKKLVDADQVIAYIAAGNTKPSSDVPSTTVPFPGYRKLRRVEV